MPEVGRVQALPASMPFIDCAVSVELFMEVS